MNDRQGGINKRVAERLYAEGRIDESAYIRVVEHARRRGMRVEDALIELDVVPEMTLLKYVATMHKTQFVSTERMSKAKLDREALRTVPKALARHFGVFPLVLDRAGDRLIVATPDPDDAQALHELKMTAGVSRVIPMVTRPEAITAAIARGYEGDRSRFDKLLQARVPEFEEMLMGPPIAPDEPARRNRTTGRGDVAAALPPAERGRLRRAVGERAPTPVAEVDPRRSTASGLGDPALLPSERPEASTHPTGIVAGSAESAPGDDWRDLELPPEPVARRAPPPPRPRSHSSSMFPRPVLGLGPLGPSGGQENPRDLFGSHAFLESLRVLVGLLENDRRDLRGHSAIVARLSANICDRIKLSSEQTSAVVIASYLHDLGKMATHHLTALNVAQLDDHHNAAEKLVRIPEQLMESVGLPREVIGAVHHMYERVGGGGLPDGLQGKDIPIGARILAVADSYADLTRNPQNPYQRLLTPDEAIDVLRQHAGVVFDPSLVEMLERATSGEKIVTDLLANRHRVLVVDPDPEETMVLQLRLVDQGFDVHVARSTEEARSALAAHPFALVVCEVDLETPEAGFVLREETQRAQRRMSWVFLSSRDSRQVVERALRLGVDDFIAKPVSHDLLVAKLTQLVERQSDRATPRGVRGSLAQMGIPEIVQILYHGRKTCALNLSHGDLRGQIHFLQGQIVDAIWGEATGETAFYRMLGLGDHGEFAVDPDFAPQGERRIHASPEGLLLEGMRLLDEDKIP